MKCPSCTAPLPAGRAQCSYCGSTTDVDLVGKSVGRSAPPEHPRACCGCGAPMESVAIASGTMTLHIDRCPLCLGLFFDTGELEAILDREVPPVYEVDNLALSRLADVNGEPVRYRRCPICDNTMNRVNYGKSSGVIADQCRDHGLFLDAGELRRIVAWVRAGGRLVAARKAAEEAVRTTRESFAAVVPEMGTDDGDVAFPRLGTFILKFLRDRIN